eukprot:13303857-Alexandrium_andersonii.AAC.1
MSASLVGSEMCIRDRTSTARIPAAGRLRGISEDRGTTTHLCTHAGTQVPVSYTHLTLPTICSV